MTDSIEMMGGGFVKKAIFTSIGWHILIYWLAPVILGIVTLSILIWIAVKAGKGHFNFIFPFKCFNHGCPKKVNSKLMSLTGSPCENDYILKNNICVFQKGANSKFY